MPARAEQKKRKKIGARPMLVLFLIFASIALFIGFWVKLASFWQERIWGGEERITLVVAQNPPVLVSYQAPPGEIVFLPLPENLEVTGANNLGKWKTESLYAQGKQQGVGGELLRLTLQNALGIPIQGWTEDLPRLNTLFDDSNLTFLDKLRLAILFSRVPDIKRQVLSLPGLGLAQRSVLPNGELGFIIKQSQKPIPEFVDLKIAKEGVGVGIVNATQNSGLGKRVARVLEGMGVTILWVKTEGELESRCSLRSSDVNSEKSLTQSRIFKLFSCEKVGAGTFSAPIELILGEGITQEFPPL